MKPRLPRFIIGIIVWTLAFALWLAETWFFGWNMRAESVAEGVCDTICLWLAVLGAALMTKGATK